jgi:hypothetical protein
MISSSINYLMSTCELFGMLLCYHYCHFKKFCVVFLATWNIKSILLATGPVLFSCMHYPFTEHMHILIQWEA